MQPSIQKRHRRKQRGNAVIEFAMLIPVLVAMFVGTWSYGSAYYIYAKLESAVRAGTRYGSLTTYDAASTVAYQTAVQNMVVYSDPGGGSVPVVLGLQTSNVNVSVQFMGSIPMSVSVSISGYRTPGMFTSPATLVDKPALQSPFMGYYLAS